MIVVFLLGFVSVIMLIVLIGCICCRMRVSKKKENQDSSAQLQRIKKKSASPSQQNGNAARDQRNNGPSRGSQVAQGQQPSFFEMETDTVAPVITSGGQVTMHETSSVSSQDDSRPYEETAVGPTTQDPEETISEGVAPPQNAAASENHPESPDSESEASTSSSSSESPPPSNAPPPIPPRADDSPPESETGARRYNTLQFSGDRPSETEMDPHYSTLGSFDPWDKSTQTNTTINIVLPDSILQHKI